MPQELVRAQGELRMWWGRFQLPCLPSIGDLNPGMRDLEVWPSGAKSGAGSSGDKAGGSKLSKPKLLLVRMRQRETE